MRLIRSTKNLAGTLAALFVAASCSDSTAPQFKGPPPLPDLESINADVGFFDQAHNGAESNYNAALAVVTTARSVTIVSMPVPVLIYDHADDSGPVQQSDGYHWTFVATDGAQTYGGDLTGRARGNVDAVWEMRIVSTTHTPALDDFLWFSGTSLLNGTSGEWRMFDAGTPTVQTGLLDVSWSREGDSSWRIIFRNIKAGSPDLNDYLEFQSATVLRRVIYFDSSANTLVSVQWDSSTNEGWITSPLVNGGVKSCWNSQFKNIVCSV